jgi:NDP-sugar pyrophosphorylase family protein
MKALLLASGKGTRMRPLTLKTHKCMLKVNEKPILEHNLNQLVGIVDEVVIAIGYLGHQIKNYFGDSYKGIKIRYVHDDKVIGWGYTITLAKNLLKGKFLIMGVDDLHSREDIKKLLKHNLGALAIKVDDPSKFGVFKIDKENHIVEFVEKPKKPVSDLASTMVYLLDDRLFNHELKKSKRGEFEGIDYLNYYLKLGEKIRVEEVKDFWVPIGYPEDLEKAEKFLKNKN